MIVKTLAEIQQKNARDYVNYFVNLHNADPIAAKEAAIAELIKMGLFSEDGKPKETIVSWE